ncbi:hypothetical protein [uncultured Desulfovibrio sp.]|uniref:hypothetical protein n=1 Tax=uncultured Desulfovibrio sp. TaxID=167968 RepID=UPI00263AEF78|nr:hypothetical protein [uncultured Desulfovibrio sp.]
MDTAEILRQKQLCVAVHLRKPRFAWQRKRACGAPFGWLRRWLRQKKIFLVEYLSTLPAKIFLFLAGTEEFLFLRILPAPASVCRSAPDGLKDVYQLQYTTGPLPWRADACKLRRHRL